MKRIKKNWKIYEFGKIYWCLYSSKIRWSKWFRNRRCMDLEDGFYEVADLHGPFTGIIKSELAKENLDLLNSDYEVEEP